MQLDQRYELTASTVCTSGGAELKSFPENLINKFLMHQYGPGWMTPDSNYKSTLENECRINRLALRPKHLEVIAFGTR